MAAKVHIKKEEFERALKRAPIELAKQVREALMHIRARFVKKMTTRQLSGRPGLRKGTGALTRSIVSRIIGKTAQTMTLYVQIGGKSAPYANVHEEGMTISKRSKKLAIPIGEGKTASRISRATSPTQIAGLKVLPRKGKNTLLVLPTEQRKGGQGYKKSTRAYEVTGESSRSGGMTLGKGFRVKGKGGAFIPMFVLVDMVRIPARLRYVDTWGGLARENVRKIDEAVARALKTVA